MIHVTLLGHHSETKEYLVFLTEAPNAEVFTPAHVNLQDPYLDLYVEEEFIETGDSLMWMSQEELDQPYVSVSLAEQPYIDRIQELRNYL